MERRVEVSGWVEFQWPYLIAFLGGEARLTELARETGAFERARKIGSPSDLLRLLLFRVGGRRSFMGTATIAAEAGVADLSDAALVKRFAKAADWLGRLGWEAIGWNEQQRLPGVWGVRLCGGRMRQANRWFCGQRSSRCGGRSRPSLRCSFGRRRAAASRPAW